MGWSEDKKGEICFFFSSYSSLCAKTKSLPLTVLEHARAGNKRVILLCCPLVVSNARNYSS